MSHYHVLNADENANRFKVVFHIPIPNGTNLAGYSVRTAVVEFQGGTVNIGSEVPFIAGTELAQLQAGELYEIARYLNSNPGETLSEKRERLDTMYTELVPNTQSRLQNMLSYWGYSRSVP